MVKIRFKQSCIFVFAFILAIGVLTVACGKRSNRSSEPRGTQVSRGGSSASISEKVDDEEKKEFEDLVDFVNCYYVYHFLDRKNVEIKELNVDIYKQLGYNEIIDVLQKYESWKNMSDKSKAIELADSINAKKIFFRPNLTKEQKIEFLLNLPDQRPTPKNNGFKGYLEKATNELQSVLEENVKEYDERVVCVDPNPSGENEEEPDEDRKENEKKEKSFWWLFVIMGFAGGVVVRGVIARKSLEKKVDGLVCKYKQENLKLKEVNRNLQGQIDNLSLKNNSLNREKNTLLEENVVLGEQLDKLKADKRSVVQSDISTKEMTGMSQSQSVSQNVLYADAILNDTLVRVNALCGEDAIFELRIKTPTLAEFVVCSNAVQRIIANPSFIEGCEKQVLPNASTIEIVSAGKAQKDEGSGKWKVIEKLKLNIK